MPWQNNGDYYGFKPESIALHAPTVSGVYGLFNFRHQIVIGSAANIRSALLHHRRHTNFHFRRFEPSGFTFEICSQEMRESRALTLSKEYNPICSPQTAIGFATLWRSWRAPEARAFKAEVAMEEKPVKNKIAPITPSLPKVEKPAPSHFSPERFGLAGAVCGVIFLVIGMVGLVPHVKNMFGSIVRNPTAIAESPRRLDGEKKQLAKPEIRTPGETPSNTVVAAGPSMVGQSSSAAVNSDASASSPTGWRAAGAQVAAGLPVAPHKPQTVTSEQPAKLAARTTGWSVQAMATTDKQLASDWLNRLKAKGYEAFVIDAEINGKTWHRVRIGSFEARQDAENLRVTLQAKEGFRDAYIAGQDKPATTIALNRH